MWKKSKVMSSFLIKWNDLIKSSNNEVIVEDQVKWEKWIEVIEPPFKFDLLVKVFETNFIANKAVDIFAKKVAYTWFDIVQDWDDEWDETLEDKISKAKLF